MKREFVLLKFIIKLFLILGWASLVGGIFSFLVIMFFGESNFFITADAFREALNSLGWGILIFALFCSWAELLKVVLAIEENTRKV